MTQEQVDKCYMLDVIESIEQKKEWFQNEIEINDRYFENNGDDDYLKNIYKKETNHLKELIILQEQQIEHLTKKYLS